jgi:hypothetical protein
MPPELPEDLLAGDRSPEGLQCAANGISGWRPVGINVAICYPIKVPIRETRRKSLMPL